MSESHLTPLLIVGMGLWAFRGWLWQIWYIHEDRFHAIQMPPIRLPRVEFIKELRVVNDEFQTRNRIEIVWDWPG